jgi:hypothetical protein
MGREITIRLTITILLVFFSNWIFGDTITNYKSFSAICTLRGTNRTVIALRHYHLNKKEYYLTVNPYDLITSIHSSNELDCIEYPFAHLREKYKDAPYIAAIIDAESNAKKLLNAGITHFLPTDGVVVTADLCPSRLPLNRILFNTIITNFSRIERPVPIALAVTGRWMEIHEKDIRWLQELEVKGDISIVWINHSYNHRSRKNLPLRKNFLLLRGTVIEKEILQTEKKMLELGIMPSVFFRFPGLISNYDLFHKITAFGLIPIGSDAWLGKNQWPKKGSIVLVHANGKEPIGVKRFLKLIRKEKNNIVEQRWFLLDLRESVRRYGIEKNRKQSRNIQEKLFRFTIR